MSLIDDLTVLILTYNEIDNIGRTLEAVKWARRILVLDSGSTDGTLDVVAGYPQATVETRAFDSFAGQTNFGLSRITTGWVLSMDADYVVSKELAAEIRSLTPPPTIAGYKARFVYAIHGEPLRATLYPPRCVLYRRDRAKYRDEGHGHKVVVDGDVAWLSGTIGHDDRKPLARWLGSQQKYARLEADYLLSADPAELKRVDRVRLMGWPAPILMFFYTLVWKGELLDGWPGWHYALQRALAETMIALEIVDRRLLRRARDLKS